MSKFKTGYGQVPVSRACRACRLEPKDGENLPLEPCPDQRAASKLLALGYVALPASQAEQDELLESIKRDGTA
jgi:hypothetical protein